MGDIRFTLIGVILIFVGFIVLGVFGGAYQAASFQSNEFGTCFEYSDDAPPVETSCSMLILDQTIFFGFVIALIAGGVISLVKGVRGDWDSRVRPEDVVGPGRSPGGKDG